MREIAKRARREDLPPPLENPHTHGPAVADEWPQWVQQLIFGGFFVGIGAFVMFLGLERWRRATFTLGITMMYLGVMRQYLSDKMVGVFSVRSKTFDLWFCSITGLGLVFLSVSVDALGS